MNIICKYCSVYSYYHYSNFVLYYDIPYRPKVLRASHDFPHAALPRHRRGATYTRIHIYIYIYTYVYIHICIYIYIYIHYTYTHYIYIYIYISIERRCVCVCVSLCIYLSIYLSLSLHMCIYIYIYMYDTCIYTRRRWAACRGSRPAASATGTSGGTTCPLWSYDMI